MNKLTDFEIDKILFKIFSNHGDKPVITLNTELEEFGLDPLDKIEIVMDLEKDFDIIIDDSYAAKIELKIKTVRDVKNFLEKDFNIVDIKYRRMEKIKIINEIS